MYYSFHKKRVKNTPMNTLRTALLGLLLLTLTPVTAQKLLDLYKSGTVKLVADPTYAQGNDWNTVFSTYRDSIRDSHVGARKSLVLLPDNSVIVNNTYRNFYTKFDAQGRFVKQFNLTTTKGKVFKKTEPILGVLDQNMLFCAIDDPGNMYVVNNNGTWLKTLKFTFMDRQIIALPQRKLAVVGWTLNDKETSSLVSLVDYTTNTQKIIWERRKARIFPVMPYYLFSIEEPIVASVGDKLMVVDVKAGEMLLYDLNGKRLGQTPINWRGELISVEAQQAKLRKTMEAIEKFPIDKPRDNYTVEELTSFKSQSLANLQRELDNVRTPIVEPSVATVIKDSDGNLLFFEYPKTKNGNNFHVWVYANGGEFVCESTFVCDDYDLIINPDRMVFKDGYLYSLQNLKNATDIPMRLVRFKLTLP